LICVDCIYARDWCTSTGARWGDWTSCVR